jgi:hypothetical protein
MGKMQRFWSACSYSKRTDHRYGSHDSTTLQAHPIPQETWSNASIPTRPNSPSPSSVRWFRRELRVRLMHVDVNDRAPSCGECVSRCDFSDLRKKSRVRVSREIEIQKQNSEQLMNLCSDRHLTAFSDFLSSKHNDGKNRLHEDRRIAQLWQCAEHGGSLSACGSGTRFELECSSA